MRPSVASKTTALFFTIYLFACSSGGLNVQSDGTNTDGFPTPTPSPAVVTPTPTPTPTPTSSAYQLIVNPGDNANKNYHTLGQANGTAWEVNTNDYQNYLSAHPTDPVPFLSYGPYVQDVPAGEIKVAFTLITDSIPDSSDTAAQNQILATVDVFTNTPSATFIVRRDIRRKEFSRAFQAQDFNLEFTQSSYRAVEFRVSYHGGAYLQHVKTTVTPADPSMIFYPGSSSLLTFHDIGTQLGLGWATTPITTKKTLTFGPYVKTLVDGAHYEVNFQLQTDTLSSQTDAVLLLDVYTLATNTVLTSMTVSRSNFSYANVPQDFALYFDDPPLALPMEFRVFYQGQSDTSKDPYILHLKTTVDKK